MVEARFWAGLFGLLLLSVSVFSASFYPDKAFVKNGSSGDLQNYTIWNNESSFQLYWNSTSTLAYDYILNPANQQVLSFWSMWHLNWWKTVGGGSWAETIPLSVSFSIVNNSPSSVLIYRNMTTDDGSTLNVTYILRAGSPLKFRVELKAGQNKQYRLVWRVDSPPASSKKLGNSTYLINWVNQHYWDYGDLYNVTQTSANGTIKIPYYNLSEEINPPSRYRLFINVSLFGTPLTVGQLVSIDPAISSLPAVVSVSNTAYWLTANQSYSSSGLEAVRFNQGVDNATLSSSYSGSSYSFNVDNAGGGSPVGVFNVSGTNSVLANLFVTNGQGSANGNGYATLLQINNSNNVSIMNLTVLNSTIDSAVVGMGGCSVGSASIFIDICSNLSFLQINNTIIDHSFVDGGSIAHARLISLLDLAGSLSYQPDVQIYNSSFFFRGTAGNTGTAFVLNVLGKAISAGTDSAKIIVKNSTFYSFVSQFTAGYDRNSTVDLENYSSALFTDVNVTNDVGGARFRLINTGVFAINVTGSQSSLPSPKDLFFQNTNSQTNYTQAWWTDIRAIDQNGNGLSGYTCTAYNNQSKQVFQGSTDANGFVGAFNLTEWNMTGASVRTVVSYSNFTCSGSAGWNQTQANATLNLVGSSVIKIAFNVLSFNWQSFNTTNQTEYVTPLITQFFANFSNSSAFDTVRMEFNGTNYSASQWNSTASSAVFNANVSGVAAGNYSFYWFANDTGNVKTQSQNFTFSLSKASVNMTLQLNSSNGQTAYVFGQTVNASGWSNVSGAVVRLLRNGTIVANSTQATENNVSLGVGDYNYTVYYQGDQNHSTASQQFFANVTVAMQTATLLVDGLAASKSISLGTSSNVSLSCSGNALLYRNTATPTLVNSSGIAYAEEIATLVVGVHAYTGECAANANYSTVNSSSYSVTVSADEGGGGGGGSVGGSGGGGGGLIGNFTQTVSDCIKDGVDVCVKKNNLDLRLIGILLLFLALILLFLRQQGVV